MKRMQSVVFVSILLIMTMLPGAGGEEEGSLDQPRRGASYINEDASTITIGNDNIEIVLNKDVKCGISKIIDKATGIDLRGNKVPPPVLLMLMYSNGSETDIVLQWDAQTMTTDGICIRNSAQLYIYYNNFRGSNLNATAIITLEDDARLADFTIHVRNDEDFLVRSVFFPVIWGLGAIGDSSEDDRLFYPGGDGIIVKDPLRFKDGLHMTDIYPSTASMQVMCHYDPDETGLYFAAYDDKGNPKKPSMDFMEWSSEKHLAAFFEHMVPESPGNDYDMGYNCKVGTFQGDWYDAAEIYSDWALNTSFVSGGKVFQGKDTPGWFSNTSVVSSSNRDGDYVHTPLSEIEKITREFNELTGVNTTHLIFAWANKGAWCGPYYFPPAAGEENFTSSMNNISDDGGHPFLYISGSVWRITRGDIGYEDYETFNDIGKQWVSIDRNGNPTIDQGYLAINWTSARMCPMTEFWQNMVVNNLLGCLDLGVDVVQIDEFPIGSIYPCYNASHGHPLGYSKDIAEAYLSILREARSLGRAVNPDLIMSMEEPCEYYIPYMDTYVSRDNAPEFLLYPFAVEIFGNEVEFVPFFSQVYHEYITAFAEPIPMNYNYPELFIPQMKRSLARACVSGEIVSGSAAAKEELRPEVRNFYKTTVQASATYANDYLIKGKPLRPPVIDVPDREVEWYFYSNQTIGRPFMERSVLNSAWKADDGDIGHVFVNWIDAEVGFDVELPAYDLHQGEYSVLITRNGVREVLLRNTILPVSIHLDIGPGEVVLLEITKVPDLVIRSVGIRLHNEGEMMTNDLYTMESSIENFGTGLAGEFTVGFFVNGTKVSSWLLEPLGPGGEAGIVFEWNTTGYLGEYNITLVVDPFDDIIELDETNNTAWGLVKIFERPKTNVKVVVTEFGTDEPIEDATVILTIEGWSVRYNGTTDDSGEVLFAKIQPGLYEISCTREGYKWYGMEFVIGEGESLTFNITLQPELHYHTIDIHVLDGETGDPLYGANVSLSHLENGTLVSYYITAPGGPKGFSNITQGRYLINVTREGYIGGSREIVLNGTNLTLTEYFLIDPVPPEYGSLEVIVLEDDTLTPIENAYVTVNPSELFGLTNSTGVYLFHDVAPGSYLINVTMEGYIPRELSIDVIAGQTTSVKVYLKKIPEPQKKLGIIRGNVTNEQGGPISYAVIEYGDSGESVMAGTNGYYVIRDLQPGNYTLVFTSPGYISTTVEGIVVEYGSDITVNSVLEKEEPVDDDASDAIRFGQVVGGIAAIILILVILSFIFIFMRKKGDEGMLEE
ncbi:MAG: DUF6259 domain-containing protein [Thermoplasmatota archaeon]